MPNVNPRPYNAPVAPGAAVKPPKPKAPVVTGGSEGVISGDDTTPSRGIDWRSVVPPGPPSPQVGGSGGLLPRPPRVPANVQGVAAGYGFDYPVNPRDSRR